MECVVSMGLKKEFFENKLKEVNGNIDNLTRQLENNRFSYIQNKDTSMSEDLVDIQVVIDDLIRMRDVLENEISLLTSSQNLI